MAAQTLKRRAPKQRKARHVAWGRNVRSGREALTPDGTGLSKPGGPCMSQATLADKCDVKQQTISGIERGDYGPGDDLKVAIANVLHQDVRTLFPLERSVA